ncbi:MAG: quinoprotein glucose dehydrogenase [Alkalicoccus sp.]|nr:MAG: quinoprotein glucose dehydrogenase [Alkalicoccus sp.]
MKAAGIAAAAVLLAGCQNGNENIGNEPDKNTGNVVNEEEAEVDTEDDEENEGGEEGQQEGNESFSMTEAGTEDWNVEVILDNLESPWAVTFDENTTYITSREGYMIEAENGETEQVDVETSDPVLQTGEGGLLGFELYEEQKAFLYYTYENGEAYANRIVRAERTADAWEETDVLLDNIEGASIHNGGRLALGPDDMLYATAGDADVPEWSQDEERYAGSILRMTIDGEVPEDNPMEDSYIYSSGHRNPQGLAWNTEEELYSSEHGAVGKDEINRIEPGNNYGWPVIEGDETEEGMETPEIHSGEDTWAPSGAAFLEDEFVTAGLRGEGLYVFDEEAEEIHLTFEGEGRLRDVKIHEEALYVLTNNTDGRGTPREGDDKLLRLTLN